jgi:hypothetical protein
VANDYDTLSPGKTLIVDFVNVIRIQYFPGMPAKRETLSAMQKMGESDVKFMRYTSVYGNLVVDSIDSDCLLIALLHIQSIQSQHNIWIRRFRVKSAEEKIENKKRKTHNTKTKTEYEIVDIDMMKNTLHTCVYQAIGDEFQIDETKLTYLLVMIILLTGSDFTRKLPRCGAKTIWERLDVIVPLAMLCVDTTDNITYSINPDKCTDILFSNIYRELFQKHVQTDQDNYDCVRSELLGSKLSDKVKSELATKERLICTAKNINWLIGYWKQTNGSPDINVHGEHGFCLIDGKVRYTDQGLIPLS